MIGILVVIYIVFISLGLPDSLFGVTWPVVHKDFMIPESFASLYSIIIGVCAGGVSFVAGPLLRKFGTPKVTYFSTLLTVIGLVGIVGVSVNYPIYKKLLNKGKNSNDDFYGYYGLRLRCN